MKKRNLKKNFALNKQTVANLSEYEQVRVVAGDGERCQEYFCALSNSAILYSSTQYRNTETDPLPADRRLWPCFAETTTVLTH